MKKDLFIILVTTLIILILLYFYNQKEIIINKEIINPNPNIKIEYPYFRNKYIDTYLKTYLNTHIDNNYNSLVIDYDYKEENNIIKLTLYILYTKNNITKEIEKNFIINLLNNTIEPIKNKKEKEQTPNIIQSNRNQNSKTIALTFNSELNNNTSKILNILEKYNIKATIFIKNIEEKDKQSFIQKINQSQIEIGEYLDKKNNTSQAKLVRLNPNLTQYKINKPIIMWSIDSLDWKYHSSEKIYQNIIKNITEGDIILMHDTYHATANSLELIIPYLLKKDYQFLTVSELLKYKKKSIKNNTIYYHAK